MKKNYSLCKHQLDFKKIISYSCMIVMLILFFSLGGCIKNDLPLLPREASKIKHVIVIYLENHSFDNLYGQFAVPTDYPMQHQLIQRR